MKLLAILPLVQVAWSEGYVTLRERHAILAVARRRGLAHDSQAISQLTVWLDQRPYDRMFTQSLKVLSTIFGSRGPQTAKVALREIVSECTKIAESSGGFLGLVGPLSEVEQTVIDRIEAVLRAS